jgi:hypothetical protein
VNGGAELPAIFFLALFTALFAHLFIRNQHCMSNAKSPHPLQIRWEDPSSEAMPQVRPDPGTSDSGYHSNTSVCTFGTAPSALAAGADPNLQLLRDRAYADPLCAKLGYFITVEDSLRAMGREVPLGSAAFDNPAAGRNDLISYAQPDSRTLAD